jgi:CubicO group peptidase (beta-lactamase class C family)
MAHFVAERVSEAARKEIPVVERVEFLRTVHRQSGGIVPWKASGTNPLEIVIRTRKGNHWARIWAFLDPREPERLGEYGVVPIRDPAIEEADRWPENWASPEEAVLEISRRVTAAADRDEFSGVILLALGDRVVLHEAFGLADANFGVRNGPRTKFNLASMNKMFTAVAVAALVEEGKLRFEDLLAGALPDYPNREAARKITLRHLLTHSAGLGMLFDRPGFDRRKRYRTSADYLPLFAGEPLLFEPGTRSLYSNEGYVVLGAVIERAAGKNYFDFVRERIFARAGMVDTDSYAIDEVVPDLAVGYARFEDDPLGIGPRRPNHYFLQWKGSAAGGGYSTAPDLLKFVHALRSHRLLSRETTETLLRPQAPGGWYGFGFQIREVRGKTLLGHGGGGPGSGIESELTWFADGSWTLILLGNYDPPAVSELAGKIVDFLARR